MNMKGPSMKLRLLVLASTTLLLVTSTTLAAPPPDSLVGPKDPAATPAPVPGDVTGGSASFTIGKSVSKLGVAHGSINKVDDIYMVDLTFKDSTATSNNVVESEGKILRIGFAATAPGPAVMTSVFVARTGEVISVLRSKPPIDVPGAPKNKAYGKCTITVTKIDAKTIEGTAECPSGMVDMDDEPSPAVSAVSFKAKAL
jgi:hypothetical protein